MKMNNTKQTIHNPSYIYIDEFNNVIYESCFTIVLGRIDSTYRFIPKSSLVIEQGLTPQMLMTIAELIKKKVGIGVKKAEALKVEPETKKKK
jgi:hypothetical protein